jgi:hypothetical protein
MVDRVRFSAKSGKWQLPFEKSRSKIVLTEREFGLEHRFPQFKTIDVDLLKTFDVKNTISNSLRFAGRRAVTDGSQHLAPRARVLPQSDLQWH